MTSEQAKELLQRYQLGQCTEEEVQAIEHWYAQMEKTGNWSWDDQEKQSLKTMLFDKINAATEPAKVISIVDSKRRLIWRISAAVIVTALCGTLVFLFPTSRSSNDTVLLQREKPKGNDVLPGASGATLTLADGKQIGLDSARNGTLTFQGAATLVNNEGTLSYNDNADNGSAIVYNTISTPRGFEYKLTLSDGTKVWLNAGSSMHFPVVFNDSTRTVEVSGEVYFEVAEQRDEKGDRKPFVVAIRSANGNVGTVEVLGTHFNINAYDEEPDTKVTLLEGSIRLAKDNSAPVTIHPGQQAKLSDRILVTGDIDIQEVMAWKEGFFRFHNADVQAIMRQAERWYDIKVIYPDGIPTDILKGAISRKVSLSQFLQIIRYSEINAKVNNGTVEIIPGATVETMPENRKNN
jgi:transmembrane sensor